MPLTLYSLLNYTCIAYTLMGNTCIHRAIIMFLIIIIIIIIMRCLIFIERTTERQDKKGDKEPCGSTYESLLKLRGMLKGSGYNNIVKAYVSLFIFVNSFKRSLSQISCFHEYFRSDVYTRKQYRTPQGKCRKSKTGKFLKQSEEIISI